MKVSYKLFTTPAVTTQGKKGEQKEASKGGFGYDDMNINYMKIKLKSKRVIETGTLGLCTEHVYKEGDITNFSSM